MCFDETIMMMMMIIIIIIVIIIINISQALRFQIVIHLIWYHLCHFKYNLYE